MTEVSNSNGRTDNLDMHGATPVGSQSVQRPQPLVQVLPFATEVEGAIIKTEMRTITPQWAARMLATHNLHNRTISQPAVDAWVAEMRCGRWLGELSNIIIGEDGNLMNGQHRLAAVVKYGTAVPMQVTTGCPYQIRGIRVMDILDNGRPRGVGAQLQISHDWGNGNRAAAIARSLIYFFGRMSAKSTRVTTAQANAVLNCCNQEVVEMLKLTRNDRGKTNSKVIAAVVIYCTVEPERASQFLSTYVSGGWKLNSPEQALSFWRDRHYTQLKCADDQIMKLTATALHAYDRNLPLKLVRESEQATEWLFDLNPNLRDAVVAAALGGAT